MARVVIIDPELTLTVPKRQTAAGGVDILTHLAEPYLTEQENHPPDDGLKELLMKIMVKYLRIVLKRPDDMDARIRTCAMCRLNEIGGTQGAMPCHGI